MRIEIRKAGFKDHHEALRALLDYEYDVIAARENRDELLEAILKAIDELEKAPDPVHVFAEKVIAELELFGTWPPSDNEQPSHRRHVVRDEADARFESEMTGFLHGIHDAIAIIKKHLAEKQNTEEPNPAEGGDK